jgi:hypothetical protein
MSTPNLALECQHVALELSFQSKHQLDPPLHLAMSCLHSEASIPPPCTVLVFTSCFVPAGGLPTCIIHVCDQTPQFSWSPQHISFIFFSSLVSSFVSSLILLCRLCQLFNVVLYLYIPTRQGGHPKQTPSRVSIGLGIIDNNIQPHNINYLGLDDPLSFLVY